MSVYYNKNAVAEDCSFDQGGRTTYAVVFCGRLLPIRFAKRSEATAHLGQLVGAAAKEETEE